MSCVLWPYWNSIQPCKIAILDFVYCLNYKTVTFWKLNSAFVLGIKGGGGQKACLVHHMVVSALNWMLPETNAGSTLIRCVNMFICDCDGCRIMFTYFSIIEYYYFICLVTLILQVQWTTEGVDFASGETCHFAWLS